MNVLTKNIENRGQVEFVSLEQMVPADHLLRQIDAAIDFHKIARIHADDISGLQSSNKFFSKSIVE